MQRLRKMELTFVLFLDKITHVAWRDFAEELDVII